MRRKILYLTTIATILFFVACSNEENLPETKHEKQRTISLTAAMPGENPTTRVGLTQAEGYTIALNWKVGDVIDLAVVEKPSNVSVKLASYTLVAEDITNEGKNARFDVVLTEDITEDFILYGVHGGGGIEINGTPHAVFPKNPGDVVTLAAIENRNDVMLYFETDVITLSDPLPDIPVTFKHLGSLFSIKFRTTVFSNQAIEFLTSIIRVDLEGDDNDGVFPHGPDNRNWDFNSGVGGHSFDMVTKDFRETNTDFSINRNHINFNIPNSGLVVDAGSPSVTVWGWYPMPNRPWPLLIASLVPSDGNPLKTSNSKAAKGVAPEAGRAYYFYVEYDGTELNFVDPF